MVYDDEVSLVVYFEESEGGLKWDVSVCDPHHCSISVVDGFVPNAQVPGGIGVGKKTQFKNRVWGEEGLVCSEGL